MKKKWKRLEAASLTAVLITAMFPGIHAYAAEEPKNAAQKQYELYPSPQNIEYTQGSYILDTQINVVYEEGIDDATKARLQEIADLKDIKLNVTDRIADGANNILVGTQNNKDDTVDNYVKEHVSVKDTQLFDKTDSYILDSNNGTIVVLGKDNDSSFYGLTTLYHVIKQLESYTIMNFHIEDFANVVSRGFIEGYYGEPWSTQDRINLMTWGGYYKLNSYFYAPKDDPKHNAKWRELYTEQELADKIRPLAEAGNNSKCRFVFALHPFMNSPMAKPDTNEAQYEKDLSVLQAKFKQVIDQGVRQIAILADDAAHWGNNNYVRLLTDMTNWLEKLQKQPEYSDLKTTLPFCTQEYMGNGEAYYKNFPKNVQIVMTGGKVWGEVTDNFTTTFKNNTDRGPYMWINWPCTDNSKKHLIMGGYSNFLHPGVNPENIQGIVLNPMQQSEPSKVAIFGNACYSWNIWESKEEADAAWDASFKYVDHNSAVENDASDALRELSKHMINQAMDSRVVALQESVELKPVLEDFKAKIADDSYTDKDIEKVAKEFEKLKNASQTFQAQAGDENLKNQMIYWLKCWDDTTEAALSYLNAFRDYKAGDTSGMINEYTKGQQAFSRSKTHGFSYIDHTEYAEVGVQHIVPFINTMDSMLSKKVLEIADPTVITKSYISDVFTTPYSGTTDDALDGNDDTAVTFHDPLYVKQGNYIGVQFNRPMDVNHIRFALGGGKNHFFHSKLQYTTDGNAWQDVNGDVYDRPQNSVEPIEVNGLDLKNVLGVRLTATADNGVDSWTEIRSIDINKSAPAEGLSMTAKAVGVKIGKHASINDNSKNNKLEYIVDGDDNTLAWLASANPDNGNIQNGQGVEIALSQPTKIKEISIHQGSGDKVSNLKVEYKDGDAWKTLETLNNAGERITINAGGKEISAIRLTNNGGDTNKWWQLYEVAVTQAAQTSKKGVFTNAADPAAEGFTALIDQDSATLSGGSLTLKKGEYIGLDLSVIKNVASVESEISGADTAQMQISKNGKIWDKWDGTPALARYVRLVNVTESDMTANIQKFNVKTASVGAMGELVSSDINTISSWGDSRNDGKGFDGNMSTATKFGGQPAAGNTAVYSFGQEINVNSLRIYTVDSQTDYIRDAEIQLSLNGTDWNTVFTIGDGVTDTDRETPFGSIEDPNKRPDSNYPNYFYYGNDSINQKARYMRILITANYPNRALAMNEIMINGGAYISTENNQAFQGTTEERGHLPSYMLDKDLTTTYKPASANGTMTYYLSDSSNIKTFRLIQNGAASGAAVTAEFYGEQSRDVSVAQVGTLDQPINEFNIPEGKELLSIKIAWGDKLPEISEIVTMTTAAESADMTELNNLIKQQPNGYDTWTTASKTDYDAIKAVAESVAKSDYVSQNTVDSAVAGLKKSIGSAEVKADPGALQTMVNEKLENNNNTYTGTSYAAYETAIAKATEALKHTDDLSVSEAEGLAQGIEAAKAALTFSIRNREIAETTIRSYNADLKEQYTTASFQAWTDAYNTAAALIEQDKAAEGAAKSRSDAAAAKNENNSRSDTKVTDTGRIHPDDFAKTTQAYQTAMAALVNVSELKAELAKFDGTNEHLYTPDSYLPYADAANAGKALLENGTKEQVADAVNALKDAASKLVVLDSDAALQDMIDQMKTIAGDNYTEESYAALTAAIADAEANIGAGHPLTYIRAMQDAYNNLISIAGLKAQVDRANSLKAEEYTASSYQKVSDLAGQAQELYKNGTQEQINAKIAEIEAAFNGLQPRAQGMDEYRTGIVLKDSSAYTEASYAAYKQAYDTLMALDSAETTPEQFSDAKEAFEKAEAQLTLQDNQSGGQGNDGQQGGNGSGTPVPDDGKVPGNGDPSNDAPASNSKPTTDANTRPGSITNVKTGDMSSVIPIAACTGAGLLAAFGALLALWKIKRK